MKLHSKVTVAGSLSCVVAMGAAMQRDVSTRGQFAARVMIGLLTGALAALPLLSEVLPDKAGDYAFPPLGTYQLRWVILAAGGPG